MISIIVSALAIFNSAIRGYFFLRFGRFADLEPSSINRLIVSPFIICHLSLYFCILLPLFLLISSSDFFQNEIMRLFFVGFILFTIFSCNKDVQLKNLNFQQTKHAIFMLGFHGQLRFLVLLL